MGLSIAWNRSRLYCLKCRKIKIQENRLKTKLKMESNPKKYGLPKFFILKRDNFRCFYCGKTSFSDLVLLEVDHLVPKSKGGSNSAINLVAACFECNNSKRDEVIEESVLEKMRLEVSIRNKLSEIEDDQEVKA